MEKIEAIGDVHGKSSDMNEKFIDSLCQKLKLTQKSSNDVKVEGFKVKSENVKTAMLIDLSNTSSTELQMHNVITGTVNSSAMTPSAIATTPDNNTK